MTSLLIGTSDLAENALAMRDQLKQYGAQRKQINLTWQDLRTWLNLNGGAPYNSSVHGSSNASVAGNEGVSRIEYDQGTAGRSVNFLGIYPAPWFYGFSTGNSIKMNLKCSDVSQHTPWEIATPAFHYTVEQLIAANTIDSWPDWWAYRSTWPNTSYTYFAQANSTYRPSITIDTALNGLRAITCGSDDYLTQSYAASHDLFTGSATLYVVFKLGRGIDAGTNYTILDCATTNTKGWTVRVNGTDLKARVTTQQAGASTSVTTTNALTNGNTYVMAIKKSGTSGTIYINGASAGTGTLNNSVSFSGNNLAILGTIAGAETFQSQNLCEVIGYASAHDDTTRNAIESCLTAKWITTPVWTSNEATQLPYMGRGGGCYVSSFTESASKRFWWIEIVDSLIYTASPSPHYYRVAAQIGTVMAGKLFDMGRDPVTFAYQISNPARGTQQFATGGTVMAAAGRNPGTYSFRWEGITDAKRDEFLNTIGHDTARRYCFLYSAGNPALLGGQVCAYGRFTKNPIQVTARQDKSGIGYNTIMASFEEFYVS